MTFAKAKSPTRPSTKRQQEFLIFYGDEVPKTFDEASAAISEILENGPLDDRASREDNIYFDSDRALREY